MTELEFRTTTLAEQLKLLQSEVTFVANIFNHLWEKQWIKKLRETNNPLSETVEASLEAFDMSPKFI